MKKLLVIIPYYNVEEHLEEAIEGILQQTYQNWHLVLIDDASTDNSRKIAEQYKDNDKISLLYNIENRGCYYSVNKVLSTFSNQEWDYWHFHGGDDVSDLTRFEKIMNYLNSNPEIIGCKSTYVRVHYDTKEVDILNGQPHIGTSEGIAFYSRKAFENLGYYDNTRFSGDTDYFWRLGAWIQTNNLDYKLGEHKECLYIAYIRKTNLTIQYDWTHDRPQYWNSIIKEINEKMIPSNNFYREIFN
jgi:glycosyltransferase involved in cell wall biosynthesis